jgi:hypothetical protein
VPFDAFSAMHQQQNCMSSGGPWQMCRVCDWVLQFS